MNTQIKLVFQIGTADVHPAFEADIISHASKLCGGCTTSHDTGWLREDGDQRQQSFTGTLHKEHCFTLELTTELSKVEWVYESMADAIALKVARHNVDTDWVHVSRTIMQGMHFSAKDRLRACEDELEPYTDLTGKTMVFTYPEEFDEVSGHAAHSGQLVTVTGKGDDFEAHVIAGDPMWKIKASDGWTGDAWASELDEPTSVAA